MPVARLASIFLSSNFSVRMSVILNHNPSSLVRARTTPATRKHFNGLLTSTAMHMHRLFQFSLRTTLLLMTAICVWLGIEVNAVQRQRAIVAAIEKMDGAVLYDWELDENNQETGAKHPPELDWLRRQIGDDYFQTVIAVSLQRIRSFATKTCRHSISCRPCECLRWARLKLAMARWCASRGTDHG
jgi:hypothetical protein